MRNSRFPIVHFLLLYHRSFIVTLMAKLLAAWIQGDNWTITASNPNIGFRSLARNGEDVADCFCVSLCCVHNFITPNPHPPYQLPPSSFSSNLSNLLSAARHTREGYLQKFPSARATVQLLSAPVVRQRIPFKEISVFKREEKRGKKDTKSINITAFWVCS